MGQQTLRVAVLGFGARAEGVCRAVLSDFADHIDFVAVADPKPNRLEVARDLFGEGVKTYPGGSEFYTDALKASALEVDGIWVLSQERTHAELAVPALERNLPLILEKPLATTMQDASRIVAAWEAHRVPVVIPHSLRYRREYRRVREIVESGVLGRILHIHAVEQVDDYHTVGYYRRGPGMYRKNTTYLLAKSSHDIDIINWMMAGVPARSVASFGGADYFKPRAEVPERCTEACPEWNECPFAARHEVEIADIDADTKATVHHDRCAWNSGAEQIDHQTVIIQYEDGTTADFTLRCFGTPQRPLTITGSDGMVSLSEDEAGPVVRLFTYHPPKDEEFRFTIPEGSHGGADIALVGDWVEAVTQGRPAFSATVHESAEAVAVCVAADIAMLERRVVEMDSLRTGEIDRSI